MRSGAVFFFFWGLLNLARSIQGEWPIRPGPEGNFDYYLATQGIILSIVVIASSWVWSWSGSRRAFLSCCAIALSVEASYIYFVGLTLNHVQVSVMPLIFVLGGVIFGAIELRRKPA